MLGFICLVAPVINRWTERPEDPGGPRLPENLEEPLGVSGPLERMGRPQDKVVLVVLKRLSRLLIRQSRSDRDHLSGLDQAL